jgi:hypothetical protein
MKSFLKSKTLWVSLATLCTGIGMYVTGEQQLQELIISVIGLIFGALRVVTKEELV